jgi:hypothetical protein
MAVGVQRRALPHSLPEKWSNAHFLRIKFDVYFFSACCNKEICSGICIITTDSELI